MDVSGATVNGRYRLDRQIAAGHFSSVYRATRLEDDQPVAVKILSSSAQRPEIKIRFRTEINTLLHLQHPGLVRIIEAGQWDDADRTDQFYLVMEYLSGTTLDRFILDKRPVPLYVSLMIKVCEVLQAVHDAGVIHGDLKPRHIFVEDEAEPRIKVIDFGLARALHQGSTAAGDNISGTFAYMAPEQVGLIRRPIDERSDLYSLGIVFYQMLCGKKPFEGQTLSELLHAQIARTPEPPSNVRKDIPPVLDRIVLRLTAKEPEARYQWAGGLLADLRRFEAGDLDFVVGETDRRSKPNFAPRTIGRAKVLGHLDRLFSNARAGGGKCCLLAGEAGIGKTRVVAEFRNRLSAEDAVILEGRCLQRETKQPWGLVRQVLSTYMKRFQAYPPEKKQDAAANLRRGIGELGQVVVDFDPNVAQILGRCPPVTKLEPEKETLRTCIVLSRFLYALAETEGGLALLLEDLHWADASSLALLQELVRNISGRRLLILATYRGNEIGTDHLLRRMEQGPRERAAIDTVDIPPFDRTLTTTFVADTLGVDHDWAAALGGTLTGRCGGNPFFIQQMLRHLMDEGILAWKGAGWHLDEERLDAARLPASLSETLTRRMAGLGPADTQILAQAAVAGRTVDLDLLSQLDGNEDGSVGNAVQRALDQYILEEGPAEDGRLQFVHDRLREAFYNGIDAEERRRLHFAIGRVLERRHAENTEECLFDLAHHFIQAGDEPHTLRYARQAARKAVEQYAYDEAVGYFTAVLGILEKHDRREPDTDNRENRLQCIEELADALINGGRSAEAVPWLETLLSHRQSKRRRAIAYWNLVRTQVFERDLKASEVYAGEGLKLLGRRLPTGRTGIIAGTVRELIVHLLCCLFRKDFKKRQEGDGAAEYRLIADFYGQLFWTYHYSEMWKAPRAILHWLNISERHLGRSRNLAYALMHYAFLCGILHRYRRALRYSDHAHAISRELGDDWLMAGCARVYAVLFGAVGQFKKGIEWGQISFDYFRKTGEYFELQTISIGLVNYHRMRGELEQACGVVESTLRLARNRPEEMMVLSSGCAHSIYAELGDFQTAAQLLRGSRDTIEIEGGAFDRCAFHIDSGRFFLLEGDAAEACRHFEKAMEIIRRNSFIPHIVNAVYCLHPEALIRDYEAASRGMSAAEKRERLKRIKVSCRKARRKNRKLVWHYGDALKVTGAYHAIIGQWTTAEQWYRSAFAHFEKYGMHYCLARARYDYGLQLKSAGRQAAALSQLEAAYALFDRLKLVYWRRRAAEALGLADAEAAGFRSLVDRKKSESILQFGREIAACGSFAALVDRVLAKSMEITGAQAGGLFLSEDDFNAVALKAYKCLDRQPAPEYSQHIVQQVFDTGEPVLTADASGDDAFSDYLSVERHGLKSILCLPIQYNDMINGVCYLQNSLAAGVFSPEDRELLGLFLPYAAIAIENALLNRQLADIAKPRAAPGDAEVKDRRLEKVRRYLHEHFSEDIQREALAAVAGITTDYLGKQFKTYTGQSIRDYLNGLRVKHAVELLQDTDMKIIDIAFESGFESLRTFNRMFYRVMGATPSSYRQNLTENESRDIERS